MRIILIPGLWLDGSAWDPVLEPLRAAGHDPVAVTLPGQGDGQPDATLDDQVAAVVGHLDAGEGPAMLVGHSAACTLAWLAADRRPTRVSRAVLVGGMPAGEGDDYANYFEPVEGQVPFPGWQAFDGPDSDDLDADARASLERRMHPVPASVTKAVVHYTDEARHRVPLTLVCPEYSPEDARGWVDGGDVPEVSAATDVDYVDLETGHWPMTSNPALLADLLVRLAER